MRDRSRDTSYASESTTHANAPAVGRSTLTQRYTGNTTPVQRAILEAAWATGPIQLYADSHTGLDDNDIRAAAGHGIADAGQPLPYLDTIQRAFGPYDISDVRAHFGSHAAEANAALGAHAYATGNDVAFATESPSLHLVAHEAAHVVQQRSGVHLSSAVGQVGDAYEREADEVADLVVAGQSAVEVLARRSSDTGGEATAIQMKGRKGKQSPPSYPGHGSGVGPQSPIPANPALPGPPGTTPAPGTTAPSTPSVGLPGVAEVKAVAEAVGAVIDTAVKAVNFWETYLAPKSKGETKGLPAPEPSKRHKDELTAMFRHAAIQNLIPIADQVFTSMTGGQASAAPTTAPAPAAAGAATAPGAAPSAAPAAETTAPAAAAAPAGAPSFGDEMQAAIREQVKKNLLALQMDDLIQKAAGDVIVTESSVAKQWWWSEDDSKGVDSKPDNWGSWGEITMYLEHRKAIGKAGIPTAAAKYKMIPSERDAHVEWLAGGVLSTQGHSALNDSCDTSIEHVEFRAESALERPGYYPTIVAFSWDQGDAVSKVHFELTTAKNGGEIWMRNQRLSGEVDSW